VEETFLLCQGIIQLRWQRQRQLTSNQRSYNHRHVRSKLPLLKVQLVSL
jgi:hypothetical protein